MAPEMLFLNISVSTNEPILSTFMRNKLNPLMVNLLACKDVPYKVEPEYKPIFAYFTFVDGRKFRTLDCPQ